MEDGTIVVCSVIPGEARDLGFFWRKRRRWCKQEPVSLAVLGMTRVFELEGKS